MTLYLPRETTCAQCNVTTTVQTLASWSQHLPSRYQLDGRNTQTPRGLTALGLVRCSHCGHTAADLAATVSPEQRAVLQKFDLGSYGLDGALASSELAGLLLYAEYQRLAQRPAARARALMNAAWMLDDRMAGLASTPNVDRDMLDDLRSSADNLRRLAARAVSRSMSGAEPLAPAPLGWAIHADLLRRAGDFEKAAAACRTALTGHAFEDDDALTVRDRLQHTLNLATDRDPRPAWVDEAEARAVDYPERLARRQARQAMLTADRKARATVDREAELARVAPLRLVELLASSPDAAPTPAEASRRGADVSVGLPESWPLPEGVRTMMVASARAYHWPKAALGLVLAAALARVLGEAASPLRPYLAANGTMLARLDDEVEYMAFVLRETTPTRWAFRAPQEGFKRGIAAANRAANVSVKTVRDEVLRRFQVSLPDEYWPSTLGVVPGEHLLSTQTGPLLDLLTGPASAKKLEPLADGHMTIGFWGYGTNSYAFYLVSKREREQLYLRLHTGGAYTDPAKAAAEITDYMPVLLWLVQEVRRLDGRLLVVQGIDTGEYTVVVGDRARQVRGSLLGRPDAMTVLQRLLAEAQGHPSGFDPRPLGDRALKIAMAQYTEAAKSGGNVRVPMRALGEAMSLIRRGHDAANAGAWLHQLLSDLAGLAERYNDLDGDHARGRSAIRRLIETLRSDLIV